MKRLLVTLAALLMAVGLSSCVDDADAQAEVDCDRVEDLSAAIANTEEELATARADVRESEGTPDEEQAKERVRELRRILRQLRGCGEAPAESTTSTSTSAPAQCGDAFVTRLDENQKNRVLSGGVQAPTSEEMRQEILDFNSHDPRGLFLYYTASPLGETSPIDNVESLVEGGVVKNGVCYSEEGMQKYQEWSVLWRATRIEDAPSMPDGWGNTGVSNGTPTSGRPPTGNTEGWMVIFVDATGKEIGRHGVMKRCGNPVTPAPVAPEGPTDEAPPDVEKPKPDQPDKPRGGKDHRKSPVSSDRDHPDERVRPVIPTPPTVIRPPDAPEPAPQPRPRPGEPPGRGDSGHGPTNTTTPPTTVAPPPAPPTTAPPTTNPPPPPPGSF